MRRWRTVVGMLVLLGLATGCFSKDQEQNASLPNTAQPVQNVPANSTGVEKPVERQEESSESEVPSTTPSGEAAAVEKKETVSAPNAPASTSKPDAPVVTEDEVASKYKGELTNLQAHYSGQLQSLYSSAIADVKAKQISNREIYAKYAKKAVAIEEESQAKVNQVLAKMKGELVAHRLPTDKVQAYRNTYYSKLDQAKSQAMSQVKKAIGM